MKEFKYTINGKEYQVEIENVNEDTNIASLKVNGEAYEVGMEKPAEDEKQKVAPAVNVNTANAVKAPLPGTITGINVKVGDEVQAGDTVVVLEAMKMANNIEAEKSGKVTAVCVKVGQSVMEDDALVVVE